MPTPTWQAATSAQAVKAAHLNQLLATHAITYVWAATQTAAQLTAGAGGVNSNGTWIAQSFTTAAAQTAVGYVLLTLGVTGSPNPLTVTLQGNAAGAPSGTALVTTSVPREFLAASPASAAVLLPVTGLTAATQYWIVTTAVGDASNFYTWNKSNQVSGASTSANGTAWTGQAYGLLYAVYDQSVVVPLKGSWEDSGARWTVLGYTAAQVTSIREYTAGQTTAGYAASSRTLTYSGLTLTGVT